MRHLHRNLSPFLSLLASPKLDYAFLALQKSIVPYISATRGEIFGQMLIFRDGEKENCANIVYLKSESFLLTYLSF